MKLSRKEIDLIEGYFDKTLVDEEERSFDIKYKNSEEFRKKVDIRKALLNEVLQLKKEDLRKQYRDSMLRLKSDSTRPKFSIKWYVKVASVVFILSSIAGIYQWQKKPDHIQVFNDYYQAYDGLSITRSENNTSNVGIKEFLNENYSSALPLLQKSDARSNPEIILAIGNCYLNLNQPSEALDSFKRIRDDSSAGILTVRDWYIALAHLKLGELEECKQILSSDRIKNSIYQSKARRLLSESIFNENK